MSHPNPTDKDELREKLAKIIDYVWQNDTPISIVPSVAVKDIMQLFDHYADQRVREARIDEVYEAIDIPVVKLPSYLANRIATLKEGKDE